MQSCQRIVSVLLILVSCVTLIPTAALADEIPTGEAAAVTELIAETEVSALAEETEVPAEAEETPADGEEEKSSPTDEEKAPAEAAGKAAQEEAEEEEASQPAAEEDGAEESDVLTVELDIPLEEVSVAAGYYADNDELFAQYVEHTMGIGESSAYTARRARKSAGSNLPDLSARVYTLLREKIAEIAAGTLTSTTISFSAKELGIENELWTAEDLGLTTLVEKRDGTNYITDEAQAAIYAQYQSRFSGTQVLYALLADCPYELYWFNKTAGNQLGFSGLSGSYTNGVWEIHIKGLLCKFNVSAAYSATGAAGTYVTNGGVGSSVQTARENAAAIVATHASESDYDKLTSYYKEICDLTAYNYTAAAGSSSYPGGYGDPWQLIWVFDGDDTTNVVCEGYAKAFQYLCELSAFHGAVGCSSVSGTMYSSNGGGGAHMWNIVTIDGDNYLVDITNCDGSSVGAPDKLFMTGASGSVAGGYTIALSNATLQYIYNASACAVFDQDDLILAKDAYTTYDGVKYEFKNRQAKVIGYTGSLPTQVVIPGTVRGCVVKAIGTRAFSGAGRMTGVTIPASVDSIEDAAFFGCSALAGVTFLGSAPSIAGNAFNGVNASVRYSVDDTWTAAVCNSYGGALRWQGALKAANGLISASYNGSDAWDSNASIAMTKTTVSESVETAIQKLASSPEKLVKYVAYDISLGSGNLTGAATVTVQTPTGFGNDCKLYRVESDGTLKNMNAVYTNGGLTFTTEHFSLYVVTRERLATLKTGDVNGDGNMSISDAMLMAQSLVGLVELDAEELRVADMNSDGTVNGLDAVLAAQVAMGAISLNDLKK